MAFEEVQDERDDREFLETKPGANFEGVVQNVTSRSPSQYGGEQRYVTIDLDDGRKAMFRAYKILLERVETAELNNGDRIKVTVEEAVSKNNKKFHLPRLFVDRAAQPAAKPAVTEDEPPF